MEGEAVAAPGWTMWQYTADLNDENGPLNCSPGYTWLGTPLASPTGGTWQSMTDAESIAQVVQTTPGTTYEVCFDYAMAPITSQGQNYTDPWGIVVLDGNGVLLTAPELTEYYVWQHFCGTFVASGNSTNMIFHGNGFGWTYGSIDGICMHVDIHNGAGTLAQDHPTLAPNPASSTLRVTGANALLRATATSATGQVHALLTNGNTLDVNELQPGVYTVQCWFVGGGAPLTQRLLVQREQ
ncbi:MAG TPA: T9SS type A sorting domain-containing protein [Flavobacteriales bacterium]|nr:T9SS type A sorting domain-containing protein [Flavobacteriales bacterium]